LIRDKKTGKSKGYGFVCFEDQRSTDLVVDNFNGITVSLRFFIPSTSEIFMLVSAVADD
jgi:RNA recognition motif-containing protein